MSIFSIASGERHVWFRDRFLEWIQIDHDEIDRLESLLACFSFVFGIAAFVKQAAVHARVQSFHAPFEHFGKGGETGNLAHRNIFFAQEISRATGGDDVHAARFECAR